MAREAREELIRELLVDNWNASNTSTVTPSIIFGWFDNKSSGQPYVTIRQEDEGSVNGGLTGYSKINPDGSGAEQTVSGTVECHIWTGRDDLDSANTNHQRVYNELAAEEIKRIVRANADRPSNPVSGNQPVQSIAPVDASPLPEPEKRDVFHYVVEVAYWYTTA